MSKQKHKIMVVGAHAGDAEIMAGALVAKYTQAGHEAVLVHLTPGEKGHRTMSPEDYAEQKIEEGHKAAAVLGAKAVFLPYKDAELPVNDEVKYALADLIRAEKPTIMITHWHGSIHKDHEAAYHIVQDAIFYAALPSIKRELPAHGCYTQYFAENWEDPEGFEVDTYVDITDSYDRWLKGAQEYELFAGQISSFRYLDYYKALAVMRGCLANCKYAVGLMRPKGAKVSKGASLPGRPL
ncbi:MAG TPA: PIG-L family deacetylase [Firmicutes bacterium]|nr:PIG-L family deacetylase [Bacillota bacterium]